MKEEAFGWLGSDQVYVGRRKQGFNVAELLDLSEPLRELVVEITRREPVRLDELIKALNRDPVEIEVQVNQLVTQGWLDIEEDESGEWVYRTRIARHHRRTLPPGIWQVLDQSWQVPIFRLFSDAVLEEFSDSFRLQHYMPGTTLFETGEWGERVYIVDEGRIELRVHNEAGDSFVIRTVGPGGAFGEMAVLMGERRPYTAVVIEEARVWTLDKSELDRLLARYPAVGLTVRRELAHQGKPASRAAEAKSLHNPAVVVGEGAVTLVGHLADQVGGEVVLVDLIGREPEPRANLTYIDGRGMRSKAVVQAMEEKVAAGAWVVVAAPPQVTDQVMRVTGVAEVVIDMTGSGAPWLRAASRRYWAMPTGTATQLARLARRLCGRVTGLVLSGGMARTLAHLGVLEELTRAGVPIDLIVGCGYGAIWGMLYASGRSLQGIREWVKQHKGDLRPFGGRLGLRFTSRPGLFDARATRRLLQRELGDRRFSELEPPCYVVSGDLRTGEVVWLKEGPLSNALAACVAVPGLVTPVEYQERLLVDAMLTDPLPADVASVEGADIIIASSVIPTPDARRASPEEHDLVGSWLNMCHAVAHDRSLDHLNVVDLIIVPEVAGFSDKEFAQIDELIECGRQAARHVLPRIQDLLHRED